MGLCLLAEVAWEQDEDLRSHLPLLLHASTVCLDSPEPTVASHALLAITHLLYSLSVRHLELARAGGTQSHTRQLSVLTNKIVKAVLPLTCCYKNSLLLFWCRTSATCCTPCPCATWTSHALAVHILLPLPLFLQLRKAYDRTGVLALLKPLMCCWCQTCPTCCPPCVLATWTSHAPAVHVRLPLVCFG